MRRSFGERLRQYRRDTRDLKRGGELTQERLAELIGERIEEDNYPGPGMVSNWESDKSLPDPIKRRNVLTALIGVFVQYGPCKSVDEANDFLKAGGYSPLDDREQAEIGPLLPSPNKKTTLRGEPRPAGMQSGTPKRPPVINLTDRVSQLGSAPPPPALVIGREDDLRMLKSRLGVTADGTVTAPDQTLTSRPCLQNGEKAALTAVRGWPGVGKTTLAAALAYDADMMAAYPDGVLWVSLGQTPDISVKLASWGRALGTDGALAKTVEEASAQLAALLRTRRMLLIVDDVWSAPHALAFRVGGPQCATLITTRDSGVAQALAPTPDDIYRLDVLPDAKALELLQALAPFVTGRYPDESMELVRELEGLPLAIQVAGHLLQAEAVLGFSVTQLLSELRQGAKLLAARAPADQSDLTRETTPTVAALLQKRTDRLDPTSRNCFAYLGPFAPKPATFDLAAMQAVWQVQDAKPIARILVERGLLEPVAQTGRFQMHALLVMHARSLLAKE